MDAARHLNAVYIHENHRVSPGWLHHRNPAIQFVDLGLVLEIAQGVRYVLRPYTQENFPAFPLPQIAVPERHGKGLALASLHIENDTVCVSHLLHSGGNEVHGRGSDEPGHKKVGRVLVDVPGGVELLDGPILHDGDAVSQGHGLHLVVGHVNCRHPEALVEQLDLCAHFHPELGIQVAEGFVKEKDGRIARQSSAHSYPLSLPSGELCGFSIQQLLDLEDACNFPHDLLDLSFRDLPHLQTEGDVFAHTHVGIKCVGLENHGNIAVLGADMVHHLVVYKDLSPGRRLKACNEVK